MKIILKRLLNRLGRIALEPVLRDVGNNQAVQKLLLHQYKDLVRRNIRPLPTFDEVGFRCYSQFEEDGIILYLFSLVGVTNKIAVEICAGDGTECNTSNLIINHGWHGFLFDGDKQNVRKGTRFFSKNKDTFLWPPTFTHTWITAENINTVLKDAGVVGNVDLLSLDVDGMEYWLWKSIDCIQPRVVVCETSNVIGPDLALTVPYEKNFRIKIDGYHGASLAAMAKLATSKGYRLVGTNRHGFNAFFIRYDIDDTLLPAVSVFDCLKHPYIQYRIKELWPRIKDLKWESVDTDIV